MRNFYRLKEVMAKLGITYNTLRKRIDQGALPELDRPYPLNSKFVGYSDETMRRVMNSLGSNKSNNSYT